MTPIEIIITAGGGIGGLLFTIVAGILGFFLRRSFAELDAMRVSVQAAASRSSLEQLGVVVTQHSITLAATGARDQSSHEHTTGQMDRLESAVTELRGMVGELTTQVARLATKVSGGYPAVPRRDP